MIQKFVNVVYACTFPTSQLGAKLMCQILVLIVKSKTPLQSMWSYSLFPPPDAVDTLGGANSAIRLGRAITTRD